MCKFIIYNTYQNSKNETYSYKRNWLQEQETESTDEQGKIDKTASKCIKVCVQQTDIISKKCALFGFDAV